MHISQAVESPEPAALSAPADSSLPSLCGSAIHLLSEGRPVAALVALDQAAGLGGRDLPAWHRTRAVALAALGRFSEAVAAGTDELVLRPHSTEGFRAVLDNWELALQLNRGLSQPFTGALLRRLRDDCDSQQVGNTDMVRFGAGQVDPTTLLDAARALAALMERRQQFEQTFAHLADGRSRTLMVDVMALRLLGTERVRLDLNRPAYWKAMDFPRSLLRRENVASADFGGWQLHEFDLTPLGVPARVISTVAGIFYLALLRQYHLQRPGLSVLPRPGDVVIDGGGCWGDSALYFAHEVGPSGRVLSLEFLPVNVAIQRQQLALNRHLAPSIKLIAAALWDRSDAQIAFAANGPGTRVGAETSGGHTVVTLSIDDLVAREGLTRLDFIKMDIEGAELAALRGAEHSLRRFKPRLALSGYHRPEDLAALPAFLLDLNVGYRLALEHYTVHREETVLFATVD